MSMTLVSPRTVNGADDFVQAARPANLNGARVALLANGKTHGEFLLTGILATLRRDYDIADARVWVKPHPSGPPTPTQLEEIRGFATVLISAIGDCGSCSSCSVFDGMNFEREGIPSAIVISAPFIPTAAAIARINGAGNFRVVPIGHPVTSKSEDKLLEDIAEATPQIVDILLSGHREADAPTTEDGIVPGTDDAEIDRILGGFRAALNNDGSDIVLEGVEPGSLNLRLVTTDASCADCVMPTATIEAMLRSAFQARFGSHLEVELSDDRSEAPTV